MEDLKLFGTRIIDPADLSALIFRFAFNFLVLFIVVRYIHYRHYKNRSYLFTYIIFGILIFFVCRLLKNIQLGLGFAFGLFALFGLLRYRTQTISIKDMTYLFIVISISMINAVAGRKISYTELVFTNFIIVFVTYLLETHRLMKREQSQLLRYEKIDLIKPERNQELLEDLRKRTGLPVHRVGIERIDFLRDIADLTLYYYDENCEKQK